MAEQARGGPGILAQDQVGAAQGGDGAQCHVAEVADGGGNQHKTGKDGGVVVRFRISCVHDQGGFGRCFIRH